MQAFIRANDDTADVHERLVQTALAASTQEENMLAAGEQILRALANIPRVRDASVGCSADLRDTLRGLKFFTNIARIDARGRVACAAINKAQGLSMATLPIWKVVRSAPDIIVTSHLTSSVSHRPVLALFLPMRGAKGGFEGALSIAIDVRWLEFMVRAKKLPPEAVVAVLSAGGGVIAANRPSTARSIFSRAPLLAASRNELFSANDAAGRAWTYVTAPLLNRSVYVGFAMPKTNLFQSTYIHMSADLMLPIFMIVLASLAIWIATDRQVTRWIVYLRRVSVAYQRGHYSLRPRLDHAPTELRMLGNALADMAEAIEDRDKRLRDALQQKSLLIREIHHRVKNNLQIVMSLLSLQAARLTDPVAQDALKQAQSRINALALVHRILHEIEEQTAVDLKPLIEGLAEQVCEGLSDESRSIVLKTDVIDYEVPTDTAVPLALFTVEILTNIFKHAFSGGGGSILLTLKRQKDARLRLLITDDGIGFETGRPTDSVGSRLIRTFAQQLSGELTLHSREGGGTSVELIFRAPHALPHV